MTLEYLILAPANELPDREFVDRTLSLSIAPIMDRRRSFDAIFVLSIILSIVMLTTAWSLSDDLFAPETEFSLNDEMLAFDQPTLPTDLDSSPQDESGLFFEDMESSSSLSSDENGVGGSFEIADCSPSELFPALGESRMRRRDGSAGCKNPASTPPTGAGPPFDAARDPFNTQGMIFLGGFRVNQPRNTDCSMLTAYVLPFGVCHSGNDVLPTGVSVTIGQRAFLAVDLQHCSPSMLKPTQFDMIDH